MSVAGHQLTYFRASGSERRTTVGLATGAFGYPLTGTLFINGRGITNKDASGFCRYIELYTYTGYTRVTIGHTTKGRRTFERTRALHPFQTWNTRQGVNDPNIDRRQKERVTVRSQIRLVGRAN